MRPYTIIADAGPPEYSDRDGGWMQRELGQIAALAVKGAKAGSPTEAAFQLGRLDRYAEEVFTDDYYQDTVRPWVDQCLEAIWIDKSSGYDDR